MLLCFSSVFYNLIHLFISQERGSTGPGNSRALRGLIVQIFYYCGPAEFILGNKAFNWYFCKAIELAYRFLVLGKYFLAWLVVKLQWRGPWRHFEVIQKK
jgi:hypothetical protein